MTVESISLLVSTKVCCLTQRSSNLQPPDHQSDAYPTQPPRLSGTITVDIFQDVYVLDAGCGTGHYAKVLADMGVGKLCLLDASSEMLNIAKHKLEDNIKQNVVDAVIKAKLPDLPFVDGTFDVVMFNNVSTKRHINITKNVAVVNGS